MAEFVCGAGKEKEQEGLGVRYRVRGWSVEGGMDQEVKVRGVDWGRKGRIVNGRLIETRNNNEGLRILVRAEKKEGIVKEY